MRALVTGASGFAGRHLLSRVAARTLRAYVQTALSEREVVPGLIVCVQTFGTVAHLHPHLHVLMTAGGFRHDGAFVRLPEPDVAVLEELWRRAVLAEFVHRGWLEEDAAAGMLAWPHSGFGTYLGPPIQDRERLLRVARYSARAPVAESRLRYDADRAEVERVADRVDGPYAGSIGCRRWSSSRAGWITCRSATRCGGATRGRTRHGAGYGGGGADARRGPAGARATGGRGAAARAHGRRNPPPAGAPLVDFVPPSSHLLLLPEGSP